MTEIGLPDNFKTSMSVLDLNNLVVKLRQPAKKSKTQVIQKLTRKIKQLKSKKGDESQIEKNNKKAARCLNHISILKNAETDNLIKFCLRYKPVNFKCYFLEPSEVEAYSRIAKHKLMTNKVNEWRSKHDDWESLANFISDHISRRLKKKPRKSAAKNLLGASSPQKSHKDDDLSTNEAEVLSTNPKETGIEKEKKVSLKSLSTSTCLTGKQVEAGEVPDAEIPEQIEYTSEMSSLGGFIQNVCLDENISDELTITAMKSADDESITTNIKKKKIAFFEGKDESECADVEADDTVSVNHKNDFKNRKYDADVNQKSDFQKRKYDVNHKNDFKKRNYAPNKSNTKNKFTDSSKSNKEFGFQPAIPNVKFHTKDKNYENYNKKDNKPKEKLHPSWEAKKRANEKLSIVQNQFKGKKIVFDD